MKVLVIGAGSFGSTVAVELSKKHSEVIVIDIDHEKLEAIKDQVGQVLVGDSTHKELLQKFAPKMDIVIVSLGEMIEASILTVLHLKELSIKKIIAKATTLDHEKILRLIGAHQVINPERDEAIELVKHLVSPNIVDFMQLSKDLHIVEVAVPQSFFQKSLVELNLRNKYELQVLAVRNSLTDKTVIMPKPEYCFQPDDTMIVIGNTEKIEKLNKLS